MELVVPIAVWASVVIVDRRSQRISQPFQEHVEGLNYLDQNVSEDSLQKPLKNCLRINFCTFITKIHKRFHTDLVANNFF